MSATTDATAYAVGSLVTARGRDWVVLPGGDEQLLLARPLGGGDDDVAGLLVGHERIAVATFAPPVPTELGDDRSARLLRDALRIGFRSTGGPFRCLGGLAVSPRPYQLVPLLLALRQETVRLLIADDVGIGKTIEAGLVAAELLAQGSARGLVVLCPPSLAPQWGGELATKFGLEPELVLPGTVRRLERGLIGDESIFTRHPVTVVSTDFIKSETRRHEFLRAAPDLVIVDEAHGSVNDDAGRGSSGRTQRYRLLRDLADQPERHLVLVTATPHSGNEGAFRNLLGLLDADLTDADLASKEGRRHLAQHMLQRRRADIRHYLRTDTKFPGDREVMELPYELSAGHRALFDDALVFVRGQVADTSGSKLEQRVRWWSALSLLRSLASSPAAAAATLATRSASGSADSAALADEIGRSEVLDLAEDDALDAADAIPGALLDATGDRRARGLGDLRRRAESLLADPASDAKLGILVREVRALLDDDFTPVVFCRFIPTAHYVAAALRRKLTGVEVESVTGELSAEERAGRIEALAERRGPRVLVATDCLSEGINLQADFQAVVHYDLAWNPTRHEQREGRVDRFGQPRDVVRALLLYGADNGIDGIILDVLLRKHERIRKDLGISVPVPPQSDQVLAALLEGLLLRGKNHEQLTLDLEIEPEATALDEQWRSTAEAEKRSRTRFAHDTVRPEEVQVALDEARAAMGEPSDVAGFTRTALFDLGATLVEEDETGFTVDLAGTPIGLRDALRAGSGELRLVADLPAPRGAAVLQRSDPVVTRLAGFVLDGALDAGLPAEARPARRCGVIATGEVDRVTTMLLLRARTHLTLPGRAQERTHLVEEARMIGFTGTPAAPTWLDPEAVERVSAALPSANIDTRAAVTMMEHVLAALPQLKGHLDELGREIADGLREAHLTVRRAARGDRAGQLTVRGLRAEAQLPLDVLGVYVLRPAEVAR